MLTNTDGCKKPDGRIRWITFRKERFDSVDGEGERHDGDRCRPHYDALDPQSHECQEPPKGDHDVGIVSSWMNSISTLIEYHLRPEFLIMHPSSA